MASNRNDFLIPAAALLILIIAWTSLINRRDSKTESVASAEADDSIPVSVVIDSSKTGLALYYPSFDSIDLLCLARPNPDLDSTIVFCCAGAYTGSGATGHGNIAGDHVSGGKRYRGYRCTRNTGAFVYYNGRWKFLYDKYSHELDSAQANHGCGYAQEMLIHDSLRRKTVRPDDNVNLFRALCELNGQLCIAEATKEMQFGVFKQSLLDAGVSEALYTDMGGWKYSWYRKAVGEDPIFIHPEIQPRETNYIVFYSKQQVDRK